MLTVPHIAVPDPLSAGGAGAGTGAGHPALPLVTSAQEFGLPLDDGEDVGSGGWRPAGAKRSSAGRDGTAGFKDGNEDGK